MYNEAPGDWENVSVKSELLIKESSLWEKDQNLRFIWVHHLTIGLIVRLLLRFERFNKIVDLGSKRSLSVAR